MLMSRAGMRLRPGLPIANLADLQAQGVVPVGARFLTLTDWLLLRGGEMAPRCHPTLAAGTGLYGLADQAWSPDLMAHAGIETANLRMPAIESGNNPIGTIQLNGRTLRVWGGLADLPAAAHGVGFPQAAPILINLGTGSQVLAVTSDRADDIELRPCASGELAHALTHIPSGRALSIFAGFFDDCARLSGADPLFWKMFSQLNSGEILAAEACVDLNVFKAAWRFGNGGSIVRINENAFDVPWLMRAIAKSWLAQYVQALDTIMPAHPSSVFLLGGGLSRRLPFVRPALESLLGRKCVYNPLRTGEETLDGLLKLAESSH
jgi:sugar (pentulose or hexulose) kinase